MAPSTNFVSGVAAATFAPFLMVLGFMIWDDHWTKKHGSAFSLNMFKCSITALWFLAVIVITDTTEWPTSSDSAGTTTAIAAALGSSAKRICTKLNPFQNQDVKFLMASSTVGILIGDWTWIEGLKYLGARKVIVMDSLKPFLAALVGWVFFGETFNNPLVASVALLLTVVGVVLVGLEVEREGEHAEQEDGETLDTVDHENPNNNIGKNPSETPNNDQSMNVSESHQSYGLVMALSNVILHTLGATLTKEFGADLTTWEINFVRFGFSGFCMLLFTTVLQLQDRILQADAGSTNSFASSGSTQQYDSIPTTTLASPSPFRQETRWYALPNLSRASWIRVTIGVVFVSFLFPALTNYAMFQIPLALLLTLESIGPLYSLPLALVMHKEYPSFRASVGALFAVTGIALLSLQGN